jgi:hypothetical protein
MRMPFVRHATRAIMLVALLAGPAVAQRNVCRAASDDSEYLLTTIKQYALAIEPQWIETRDSLRIPGVSSADSVVLITKESTCKAANAAYRAAATGARQTLTGRVFVVRVGSHYVVHDPGYLFRIGGHGAHMVFDSRWALRRTFIP